MIVDFIINLLATSVKTIFGVLPNVAATPQSIVDGGNWIITTIGDFIAVLNMLFTAPLVAGTIIIAVGIFNFEWIYHTTLWIIKKIPMINIK